MKSLLDLTHSVMLDLSRSDAMLHKSTVRDMKTVADRFEDEGASFLTIALPAFAKDLQRGLEQGGIGDIPFLGFRKRQGLPVFLRGFLLHIFDEKTGSLLDDPSVEAIYACRQILMLHAKILLECAPRRVANAFDRFVETENELKDIDARWSSHELEALSRMGVCLFADVLAPLDNQIHNGVSPTPRHGPGATSDRLLGNNKWSQRHWPTRLNHFFPWEEYVLPSPKWWFTREPSFVDSGAEMPVKVVSVPKTLLTPRIIAIEPTAMQYCQQALASALVPGLEGSPLVGPLIGFTDQIPNREMARRGSVDGSLATLDLKDASDRVSNQLVRALLQRWPTFYGAVDACRTRTANVPGHGDVRLAKFASMGSALCFPIEAMVFLAIVMLGIESAKGPLSKEDIHSLRGQVRVYGDDIIVPVEYVQSVIAMLETYGLIVSLDKSFSRGRFRESCGGDYYLGEDVTPIRCRREFPASRQDVDGVVSLVALRNLFYQRGLWGVAGELDRTIERILDKRFPVVDQTSSLLGRWSVLPYQAERDCRQLHRPLVRGWVVKAKPPVCKLDGIDALTKFLVSRGEYPMEAGHLERSGRPRNAKIIARWATPF